jgi:M6 family metalloprotease-like protein
LPNDPTDADGDGFISGHVRKWWEAVTKADPSFNFANFDSDGDGILDPKELGIVIVIPQTGPYGTNRVPASREYPSWEPLVVDGVTIPMIAEVYAGAPPNLGVFVHELCHLLLNLPDEYFPFFFPFAAGAYSIMDVTYIDAHIDPFLKMRLGWLQPTIADHNGTYYLYPSENGGGAFVLVDPAHGNSEYYIVENRQRSFSYDTQLPDTGMAVWHIMEDPAVFGTVPTPAGVSASDWGSINPGDWGRRAIRMIRPVYGPPFNNASALWDGSDPATGYDLVSSDPTAGHGQLLWADGSPSGFAIRDISPATPVMSVVFELPESATGTVEPPTLPGAYALHQNYPNPFNPTTTIRYQLPIASDVRLAVYDVLGREITRLVHERQPAGSREVVWNASGASSGVYFCRLEATGTSGERFVAARRLVLLK